MDRVAGTATAVRATVHVDLDGLGHVLQAHGWPMRTANDRLFTSGLSRTLEFLGHRGITATLFAIGEDIKDPEKRKLIVAAASQGHEIASHGLTHRPLTAMSIRDRELELSESRDALEQAIGAPVLGLRAPLFATNREVLAMAAAAGYSYDSSVFFGTRAPRGGLAAGWDLSSLEEETGLRQLALPSYEGLPWPFHPSYSLVLGSRYFSVGLDRALRSSGHPLVFLMHLTDLADPLPRAELPTLGSHLFTLSVLSAPEKVRRMARMMDLLQSRCAIVATTSLLHEDAAA